MRAGEMGYTTTAGRRPRGGGGDVVSDPASRRVELYDTTLRDGAQQADLSYTVEDRLRILHKLDQVGFPYIEGGWPGANPRDTEFFQLATKETLQARAAHRVRHDAAGRGARRGLAGAARPARRRHRGRLPRRQGVGPARHRGAAHRPRRGRRDGARLGRVPARAGPAGVLRRRALLRRLPQRPGVRDARCSRRPRRPAPSGSCSATRTAACCRSTSRAIVRGREGAGDACRSASTCTTTPAARSRTRWSRSTPACYQVQGTVNGYGERTGNADLIPITADLVLKMGVDRRAARGSGRAPHRARALRGGDREPRARFPPAVRGALRVHAQGGAAHERRRPRLTRPTSTSPPETVGNRRGRRGVGLRRRRHDPDEGRRSSGSSSPTPRSPPLVDADQGARAARVRVRRGRGVARAADASRRRMVPAVLRDRELPRPRRGARRRRRAAARRGDRQGPHEGHAAHRVRRGTGSGGRARQRAAQGAHERLPRSSTHMELEDFRVRVLDRQRRHRAPSCAC